MGTASSEPGFAAEPLLLEGPAEASARVDAERVCEAYRASDLVQPRPGLIIRVRA